MNTDPCTCSSCVIADLIDSSVGVDFSTYISTFISYTYTAQNASSVFLFIVPQQSDHTMIKNCKLAAMVNDQRQPNRVKPKPKPKPRKPPVRASNVMDGAHKAWPMAHDAHAKLPGVPPGQSAFMPNGLAKKKIIRYNQDPAGSCASCTSKMKVFGEHTKVRHLTNGHGKHMTRRATINVMKDEINNKVRFTHTHT